MRTRYDRSVAIIVRVDAGFFDEQNFALCDDLGIGFVATGKVYDAIKQKVWPFPAENGKNMTMDGNSGVMRSSPTSVRVGRKPTGLCTRVHNTKTSSGC
jgi:hypothetical protein